MRDVLILGGGVIGLSLAYELAGRGRRVHIVDRGPPGRETSWAAAGIFPPCNFRTRAAPPVWLAGYSNQLHVQWAQQLREETGIDTGYRRCGGIHLADTAANATALLHTCDQWQTEGLTVKWLHGSDIDELEPALAGAYDRCHLTGALLVAEEAQVRTPRHLRALIAACTKRGVKITSGVDVHDFETNGERIAAVRTNIGPLQADRLVIACGAWTEPVAARLGLKLPVKPMRGQIALLETRSPIAQRIVNHGAHYILPRDDGRVLVGTTMEDVGFDRRNTAAALADILKFAVDLAPPLKDAALERAWVGFRPSTPDNLPYIGPAPGWKNTFVAAGHFRHGLYLSPGTAVLLSRLIHDEPPGVDMSAFRLDRAITPARP